MGQSRRQFLKSLGQLGLAYTASQCVLTRDLWAQGYANEPLFAVMQGPSSHDTVTLSLDVPANLPVQFRLVGEQSGELHPPIYLNETYWKEEPWVTFQLAFSNLNLGETYYFHILDSDLNLLDERRLKTLDLFKTNPKIGLISCMWDRQSHTDMWDTVYAAEPDLLFFLGDNVYGDKHVKEGPMTLRKRYLQTRQVVSFYHRRDLIPVWATWDDHDYGTNDGFGDYVYKEQSTYTFNAFYSQKQELQAWSRGPGVSSVLDAFGAQFFFLDSRSFRSHKKDRNGSLLGELQKDWLMNHLRQGSGPAWLICGSQFFGTVPFGAAYQSQFKDDLFHLMEEIRTTGRSVCFVSGDIHRSETLRVPSEILGYESFEITSSGLHTRVIPILEPNKNRREKTRSNNFILAQPQMNSDHMGLVVDAFSKAMNHRFRDNLILPFA